MHREVHSIGRGGRLARREVMRGVLAGGLLLVAAPMAAACGGQTAGASAKPTAKAPSGPVVDMTDQNRFVPESLTIAKGTTVTWKNPGSMVHNVVTDPAVAIDKSHARVPAGAKSVTSSWVNGGGSWSYTFDVAGEYRYFCQPHETLGMVGTVIVTE
jgi:plastocyanin